MKAELPLDEVLAREFPSFVLLASQGLAIPARNVHMTLENLVEREIVFRTLGRQNSSNTIHRRQFVAMDTSDVGPASSLDGCLEQKLDQLIFSTTAKILKSQKSTVEPLSIKVLLNLKCKVSSHGGKHTLQRPLIKSSINSVTTAGGGD